MKELARHLFTVFAHLGGFGLLGLGVLDSSFLVMPLGNDLLIVALTARRPDHMVYYALMAAAGSVLGCLLMDLVCRKGGEEVLEKHVPRNRYLFVHNRVNRSAGWALAFASLMPPPFPFTPFVIAAAVLEYPRKKLLGVVAASRTARFLIEGILAILFGRKILAWAAVPWLAYGMAGLIVLSIATSALSIYEWVKKSKDVTQPVRSGG